jgi:uncharacterized radical SAM superfamily Fe-S cluster-containing enzyme
MILNNKKYKFEENPFPILLVDLTKKCNLHCNVCYAKDLKIPEIDIVWFENLVTKLPNKNVYFMLLGGEPTLSENFFNCIDIILKYNHTPFICTNGIKIGQDITFVEKLESYNGKLKFHIDMSGGLQSELYTKIHGNSQLLNYKLNALNNIEKYNLGKVSISMILINNVNDIFIDDIFKVSQRYNSIIEMFFRPQIKEGEFIEDDQKYTINRTINLLLRKKLISKKDLGNIFLSGMTHEKCEGKHCCFKIFKNNKIIGFYNLFGQSCWQRGRIVSNRNYIKCYTADILSEFDKNRQ